MKRNFISDVLDFCKVTSRISGQKCLPRCEAEKVLFS